MVAYCALLLFDWVWAGIVFYTRAPGLEVIKLFSYSTQQNMKFFLLINVKMPTIVGILTISGKNSILDLSEPTKGEFIHIFILMSIQNFMLQLSIKKTRGLVTFMSVFLNTSISDLSSI